MAQPIGCQLFETSYEKLPISIDADDTQFALLERATLESWPNDPLRLRFVWRVASVGTTYGQWFSRMWDMPINAAKVLPVQWL